MRFCRAYRVLTGLALFTVAATASASIDSTRAMIAEGDLNRALESLQGSEAQDAETLFLRGTVLAELGRDAEAERAFRDLIERYPDHPEPYNNLAVLLAGAGRLEEAVATLKDALRTHPSYRTAWDNLTTIYGRLASAAYSRALNVDSSSQTEPVKLALLGTLSGAEAATMTPVETVPAVAVAPLPQVTEEMAAPAEPEVPEQASADEIAMTEEEQPMEDDLEEIDESIVEEPEALALVEEAEPEVTDVPSAAQLTAMIEAWAASWTEQRVDDYLSFYSDSFAPSSGMELAEWRALRRSRIESPEYIRVSVALLEYEVDGDDASVVFNQSYESNTFSDLVTKTLALTLEGGDWKIVGETVGP